MPASGSKSMIRKKKLLSGTMTKHTPSSRSGRLQTGTQRRHVSVRPAVRRTRRLSNDDFCSVVVDLESGGLVRSLSDQTRAIRVFDAGHMAVGSLVRQK
jgi:hypothetical protein